MQRAAEKRTIAGFYIMTNVNQAHRRKIDREGLVVIRAVAWTTTQALGLSTEPLPMSHDPLRQHQPVEKLVVRLVCCDDVGSSAAEEADRAEHSGIPQRCVGRMIARGGTLLLVRLVVRLVHNNQPDIGQRSEQRAPRPDDHLYLARSATAPRVESLALRQLRVQQADAAREP